MANQEHLKILLQGTSVWNAWREKNPSIRPDLTQAHLPSASLEAVNLANADLRKANLESASLQKANLENADLQRANLDHALLLKATLTGALLQQATLRGANFYKATLESSNLQQANMAGAVFPYANLRKSDLSFSNLAGAKLEFADLRRSTLMQASLRGANLNHADLRRAHLQDTKLDRSILHGANLMKADLSKATFHQADLSRADLHQANLQEAHFEEANLYLVDLRQARMDGAHFQRSLLAGSHLQDAILCYADLEEANLEEANLEAANLYQANLQQANLEIANLSHSNMEGCSLKESTLTGAQVVGANLRKANLSGAILDSANFRKADLSHASMHGIPTSSQTTVADTSFGMANLTGTKLPSSLNGFRETLKNLEETSKQARLLHAWLIGICLFSLLTVFTSMETLSKDNTLQLPLPLFQVQVPSLAFLVGVPLLGLVIFVYFHFYLSHLYQSLATLPAYFPDGLSLRQRLYPWILNLCIHEWQMQSLGKLEQVELPDRESFTRELFSAKPWRERSQAILDLLPIEAVSKLVFSHTKTGIVALIGWGLLPLTIAALSYPLLINPSSTVTYVLLGFLTVAMLTCIGSCNTARSTARGEKVGQGWWMPVTVGMVLVLSGLIMSQQGLVQDPAQVAQFLEPLHSAIP